MAETNYIATLLDLMKAPLFSEFAKRYGYGARKGFDVADIIDVPIRVAQSIAAPMAEMVGRGRATLDDLLSELPTLAGEPYTPETIAAPVRATGTVDDKGIGIEWVSKKEGAGYRPSTDTITIGSKFPSRLGRTLGLKQRPMSEPAVIYEELAHARAHRRGAPITKLTPWAMKTGSQTLEYLSKIPEEARAKAVALKDVFTKEGIPEGLLSVPGAASSLLSYIIPGSRRFVESASVGVSATDAPSLTGRDMPTGYKAVEPFTRLLMRKFGEGFPGEPDYFADKGRILLDTDPEQMQQLWENPMYQAYMRASMAQSSNPLNQLAAYFGIKPLDRQEDNGKDTT